MNRDNYSTTLKEIEKDFIKKMFFFELDFNGLEKSEVGVNKRSFLV